jgi:hypothetical protein
MQRSYGGMLKEMRRSASLPMHGQSRVEGDELSTP